MKNSRFRLKTSALSLAAVLGLLTFSAAAAQAEDLEASKTKRGTVTVLGSEALAIGETVVGQEEGTVTVQVPALDVEKKMHGRI